MHVLDFCFFQLNVMDILRKSEGENPLANPSWSARLSTALSASSIIGEFRSTPWSIMLELNSKTWTVKFFTGNATRCSGNLAPGWKFVKSNSIWFCWLHLFRFQFWQFCKIFVGPNPNVADFAIFGTDGEARSTKRSFIRFALFLPN